MPTKDEEMLGIQSKTRTLTTYPLSENPGSLEPFFSGALKSNNVDNDMRYEWLRLRTFSTFPLCISHSPVRLARSGFYYTRNHLECVCFLCGRRVSDWTGNNVTEIHRQISPNCRHLAGIDETNVPIGSNFSNQSLPEVQPSSSVEPCHTSQALARSPYRQPTYPSNSLQEVLGPLGVVVERPRYPSYSVLATRISSFQQWPSHFMLTPRNLSIAGFFYAGYGDYVRCFFCGGGLRNWEPGDDAWVEHARWFSKCSFLLQNRGQDFVDLVLNVHSQDSENPGQVVEAQEYDSQTHNIDEFPAAQQVFEMGYTWETIRDAYRKIRKRKTGVSPSELVEEILITETPIAESRGPSHQRSHNYQTTTMDSNAEAAESDKPRETISPEDMSLAAEVGALDLNDETHSLLEENRQLREQRLCRICLEEDVAIAFLPCGHLCCCAHCAPAMRKCPICRAFIKETIRTFPA
ncbi:baculoviral IAP repeat-containing protein 3-like [Saccostrea echinata]|uniref:baculoviral IAP repeat-containing protein 3-like n=1 Tax=Saccostrea echinata TaxID=191078 RepID=UPI002A7F6A8C|nr:baculoviral IAP repeat-containing protein 3-like [Saccostrea echinata]